VPGRKGARSPSARGRTFPHPPRVDWGPHRVRDRGGRRQSTAVVRGSTSMTPRRFPCRIVNWGSGAAADCGAATGTTRYRRCVAGRQSKGTRPRC
jgi:hypothetical protein